MKRVAVACMHRAGRKLEDHGCLFALQGVQFADSEVLGQKGPRRQDAELVPFAKSNAFMYANQEADVDRCMFTREFLKRPPAKSVRGTMLISQTPRGPGSLRISKLQECQHRKPTA